jgi:hypothetical protein
MDTISGRGVSREVGVAEPARSAPVTGLRPAPLRPLGAAEILDGAVRLARRNIRAVLSISVPYAIVVGLAIALLQYGTIASQDGATFASLGTLVLAAGLGTVLTGLLAPVYSADLLGGRLTAAQSLSRVGRRAWSLFALGLVVTAAEGVGVLACLVGGVYLWGAWAVAAPALVLEGAGVRRALGRSLELVRRTFWRVWGLRALGWLLTYVLTQLVVLPFQALAYGLSNADPLGTTGSVSHPAVYVTLFALGQLVASAFLAPVTAGIELLLYSDLRMRKEGMDIVLALPPAPGIVPAAPGARPAW